MLVERVAALSPKKAGEMIDPETCRSGVTRALTPSQMLFPALADGLHEACFRKFWELDEVEGGRKRPLAGISSACGARAASPGRSREAAAVPGGWRRALLCEEELPLCTCCVAICE